jgi:hypothetical protein
MLPSGMVIHGRRLRFQHSLPPLDHPYLLASEDTDSSILCLKLGHRSILKDHTGLEVHALQSDRAEQS